MTQVLIRDCHKLKDETRCMEAAVVTLIGTVCTQTSALREGVIDLTQVLGGRKGKSTTISTYHQLVCFYYQA